MMDCTEAKKYLVHYGEDEMPPAVFEHVEGCPACASLLAGYRELELAIAAQKAKEPNPFAATRIMARLENEEPVRHGRATTVLRPVLITLALLVALMAGFLIGNAGYSRLATPGTPASASVEALKSDLFIRDFVDEDITLVANK
jgi:hypothetical protein